MIHQLGVIIVIIQCQDMVQSSLQDIVKVGERIMCMTWLVIVGNGHKRRTAPEAEIAEVASVAAMALATQLLTAAATFLLTASAASSLPALL